MKKRDFVKIGMILVFLIALIKVGYGAACPSDLNITVTYTDNLKYCDTLTRINIKDESCSVLPPPGNCWNGYNNATISLPPNLTTSNSLNKTLATNTNSYFWSVSCNLNQNYTINVTFDNGTVTCDTNITLYLSSYSTNPSLEITFPTIPNNFTIGSNYTFNLTLNNTGDDNATDVLGSISYNTTMFTLTPSSINISKILNGSWHNFTINVTFLYGGDTSFSIDRLYYSRSNGIAVIPASGTSNTFHVNFNPVLTLSNITLSINSSILLDLDDYWHDSDAYDTEDNVNWTYSGNVNINIALNATTRVINFSSSNWVGRENITFQAKDLLNATTNQTISIFVENSSTDTCNGIDDDGDTLIDENSANSAALTESCCPSGSCDPWGSKTCTDGAWSACTGYVPANEGGGGGGGSSSIVTEISPHAQIDSPSANEEFKIDELIEFSHSSGNYNSLEWNFGDGTRSSLSSPTHSYSTLGSRIVKLTVYGTSGTSTDSVSIKIVECFEDDECAGLCCDGKCKNPCTSNQDCEKPDPYINELCISPGTCDAECSYDLCDIACSSDDDCDNDPESVDRCINPGKCDSLCLHKTAVIEHPSPAARAVNIIKSYGRENPDIIQEGTREVFETLLEIGKIGLDQRFEVKDGKSSVEYRIKNSNIFTARNITVDIDIPKDIAESADEIGGDFITIKKDPIIRFIIEQLKPGEEKILEYTLPREVAEEKLRQIQISILKAEPTEEELERLTEKQQKTENATIIKTEAFIIKDQTQVRTSIEPKRELENVTLYLEIPKCLAETIDEIEFEREDFTIIQDDPVIAWVFPKIDENIKLDFKVAKAVDEDCWRQIQALPLAEFIKGRIYKRYNYLQIAIIILSVFMVIGLGLFFAHHEEALKHPMHHGKHILHKDILKHSIKSMISGFDHLFLALIIILNVLDFFEVLNPTGDLIKKILSWTLLGYLVYKVKLSEIFFGKRSRLLDLSLLTAFFALVSKNLFGYIRVANNEIIEYHLQSLVIPLYQAILVHSQIISTALFIFGISLLVSLSVLYVNFNVKSPSMLAILHEKGRPSDYKSCIRKFFTIFILFFAFYILVFNFVMEWLAIAADATIAVIGLAYFAFRIIRSIIRILKHHRKHLYINKVFVGAGTFAEELYEMFIKLFHSKKTLLLGIAGILTFHLFADVINFIIPYIFNLHDVIYFGRLGVGHSSIASLLNIILPRVPSMVDKIAVIGVYFFNTIAMLFLLVIPFYIWLDILTKKKIDFHPILIGLFYASIIFPIFVRAYNIKTLIGKDILGVDILILNVLENTHSFKWIYLIAIPLGLAAFLLSYKTKYRHILEIMADIPVILFFYAYIICFLISWCIYYTFTIINAFNYSGSSVILTYVSYILPLILVFMYLITVLFYVGGLTALVRYMYMHWILPRLRHFLKGNKLHLRRSLKKRLKMLLSGKARSDYSLTEFDLVATVAVSTFPISFFLLKLFLSASLFRVLIVLSVWIVVIAACLLFVFIVYRATTSKIEYSKSRHAG